MKRVDDHGHFTMGNIWGIAIFTIILLIILVAYNSNKPHYVLNPQESLDQITNKAQFVNTYKMAEILKNNDSLYQIIDLRNPMEFAASHIKQAINIPVGRLFDKKFDKILNQSKKINILIGSTASESILGYMLMVQEGYQNLRAVKYGYHFIQSNIVENFAPMSGKYDDSRAYYDYNKIVSQTAGASVGSSSTAKPKKAAPVKRKKKAAEEEGGC